MKDTLIKIKNRLKTLTPFKKFNPHIYWNNLLYLFFLAILILLIFSFYLLYKIKNQQILQITPSVTETPSLINEKLLKKINESFDSKLIKEKEIQEGGVTYKDPSMN